MIAAGSVLLLGYGNELRGDDGAGPRVAREVASWRLPEVRVLTPHQLTPELAEPLAGASLAIFVDASLEGHPGGLWIRSLRPSPAAPTSSHGGDPGWLLALAARLFGHAPEAYLLAVPGVSFGLGEGLSRIAQLGVEEALRWIGDLLHRRRVMGRQYA